MTIVNTDPNLRKSMNLQKTGVLIMRYGLALVLIWIGILKFSSYEAEGIKPLAENSPLLAWIYDSLGVQGFSNLIGFVEIGLGMLISCRFFSPKISALGSIGAIITFLVTLTFLISTPGIVQANYSFPFISPMPGQFLIKDIVLIGVSVFTAGEALNAGKNLISNEGLATTSNI